jgi:hypothetical protein
VDADAHADRGRSQSCERFLGRRKRARRGREGNEEGVPLRVDLDAAVPSELPLSGCTMVAQGLRVSLGAELMQELR